MNPRIAVGIWEDMERQIHWNLTELFAMVDLPDTPANRERTALLASHTPAKPILRVRQTQETRFALTSSAVGR